MKTKGYLVFGGLFSTLIVLILVQNNTINNLNQELENYTEKSKKIVSGKTFGIDVSHHQGKIDWKKVNKWNDKTIEFAYIKATEGATYIDKTYKSNFKGAKEQGILTGSYHYFRTTSSVEEQFKNFIQTIDKENQDLIPLIDVEENKNWNNTKFHENFKKFLNLVEDYFGQKPMIYTVNGSVALTWSN